jgi:hypothetical protein
VASPIKPHIGPTRARVSRDIEAVSREANWRPGIPPPGHSDDGPPAAEINLPGCRPRWCRSSRTESGLRLVRLDVNDKA